MIAPKRTQNKPRLGDVGSGIQFSSKNCGLPSPSRDRVGSPRVLVRPVREIVDVEFIQVHVLKMLGTHFDHHTSRNLTNRSQEVLQAGLYSQVHEVSQIGKIKRDNKFMS